MDTGLPDIPEETPELVVPGPPSPNDMSDVMPAVGYACVPLPSVNNGVMPELIRMPAFPQTTGRAIDRAWCLGGGWLVRVLSWRIDRRNRFAR